MYFQFIVKFGFWISILTKYLKGKFIHMNIWKMSTPDFVVKQIIQTLFVSTVGNAY